MTQRLTAAAEETTRWLETQSFGRPAGVASRVDDTPAAGGVETGGVETGGLETVDRDAGTSRAPTDDRQDAANTLGGAVPADLARERPDGDAGPRAAAEPDPDGDLADGAALPVTAPTWVPHMDWLAHRLVVSGPAPALAGFRAAASGWGTIPWRLDLDRLEEEWFHRLLAPPWPQRRTLSRYGARALAAQLREAVERREAAASFLQASRDRHGAGDGEGHGKAAVDGSRPRAARPPLDLHALIPVPDRILHLGPNDPAALTWLWRNWGTTAALRHVAEDTTPPRRTPPRPARSAPPAGPDLLRLRFESADWTPWRAFERAAGRWPALRFDVRPIHGRR